MAHIIIEEKGKETYDQQIEQRKKNLEEKNLREQGMKLEGEMRANVKEELQDLSKI